MYRIDWRRVKQPEITPAGHVRVVPRQSALDIRADRRPFPSPGEFRTWRRPRGRGMHVGGRYLVSGVLESNLHKEAKSKLETRYAKKCEIKCEESNIASCAISTRKQRVIGKAERG